MEEVILVQEVQVSPLRAQMLRRRRAILPRLQARQALHLQHKLKFLPQLQDLEGETQVETELPSTYRPPVVLSELPVRPFFTFPPHDLILVISTSLVNITLSSGPNGSQDWLDCGLETTGWKPQLITLDDLIYHHDLEAAMAQASSPFKACAGWLDIINKYSQQFNGTSIFSRGRMSTDPLCSSRHHDCIPCSAGIWMQSRR